MVTIRVLGLAEAEQRLAHVMSAFQAAPGRVTAEAGQLWLDAMKHEGPRKTGRMVESLNFTVSSGTSQASASFQGVDYTRFVIGPDRAHLVVPRHAHHLRFVIAGRVVFARRARIPANPGNPFPQRALARIQHALVALLERTGAQITGV